MILVKPVLTQAYIAAALRSFGVLGGAGVIVHSSFKSFGGVEGGPAAVCAALMEVVTAEGTLLLPSFNHDVPFRPGGAGVYDPLVTPTGNGAIPDAFWRMAGVRRSLDPTHPVAAWGRNARRYTENHHRTLTMGPLSPLGLLGAEGGYGLLLGVGFGANTYHHVVEMTTGAPCLGKRSEAYPVRLADGRVVMGRTWGWRESECPIDDPHRYEAALRERGLVRQIQIGGCTASLFLLQDCFAVVSELLRDGLGEHPPCSSCPVRPRRTQWTVEPDWDESAGQPRADSDAWTY